MESTAAGPPGRPGCYLLVVVSEPLSVDHKERILQKVAKGLLSWDVAATHCDLTEAEEAFRKIQREKIAKELLIQHSTERVAVEVLFNPQLNTLKQCLRNLLASNTCHKHLIHAGYAFTGSGSWIIFDGIFCFQDLLDAFQHPDVQRSLQSQARSTVHVHCTAEGDWTSANVEQESLTKVADISLNPPDKVSCVPGGSALIDCLDAVLVSRRLEERMTSSSIVGSIRFHKPTLYIFPGGQGDCALFGVNGFTMLVDGGFNKIPCFWEFIRHLDRLDALMITRLNETNLCGISSLIKRKTLNNMYPQIGYVFCNVAEGKLSPSDEMLKDRDELLLSVINVGHEFLENLYQIGLKPHLCLREPVLDPLILYHKVGHGTLEMYILGPPKDSRELRDFLHQWSTNKENFTLVRMGSKSHDQDVPIPLSHAMSICSLLVWRPAEPKDTITRILFPGSAPQNKILEGLEKLKNLDVLKQPVCTQSSLQTTVIGKIKSKPDADQVIQKAMSGRAAATPSPVPIGRKPAKSEESIASKKSSIEDIRIKTTPAKPSGKRTGSKKSTEAKKEKKADNKEIKSTASQLKKETKVNGVIKGPETTTLTKTEVPEARTKGIKELNNKKAVEAKIASRKSESLKSRRPATPPKSPLKQIKSKSPASSPKHEPKTKEKTKTATKLGKVKKHETKPTAADTAEEKPKVRKISKKEAKLKEAEPQAVPKKKIKDELPETQGEKLPDANKVASEDIKEALESEKVVPQVNGFKEEPELPKETVSEKPHVPEEAELKKETYPEKTEKEHKEEEEKVSKELLKEPPEKIIQDEQKEEHIEAPEAVPVAEKQVDIKAAEETKPPAQEEHEVPVEPEGPSKEHLESEGVTGEEISEIETEEMSPEMEGEKNEILEEGEELGKAVPSLIKAEKIIKEKEAAEEEKVGKKELAKEEVKEEEIEKEKVAAVMKEPEEEVDIEHIEQPETAENVMSLQKEIEEYERQHMPELKKDEEEKEISEVPSEIEETKEEEEEKVQLELTETEKEVDLKKKEEMEIEDKEIPKEVETKYELDAEIKEKVHEEDISSKELKVEKKEADESLEEAAEEQEALTQELVEEETQKVISEIKGEEKIEEFITETLDETKAKLKDVGRVEEIKAMQSQESSGSETEITVSEKTVQDTEAIPEIVPEEMPVETKLEEPAKKAEEVSLPKEEEAPLSEAELPETAIEKSEDESIKDIEGKKALDIPTKVPEPELEEEQVKEEKAPVSEALKADTKPEVIIEDLGVPVTEKVQKEAAPVELKAEDLEVKKEEIVEPKEEIEKAKKDVDLKEPEKAAPETKPESILEPAHEIEVGEKDVAKVSPVEEVEKVESELIKAEIKKEVKEDIQATPEEGKELDKEKPPESISEIVVPPKAEAEISKTEAEAKEAVKPSQKAVEDDELHEALLEREITDQEYEKEIMEKEALLKESAAESSEEYESDASKEHEISSEESSAEEKELPEKGAKDELVGKEKKHDKEYEDIEYKDLQQEEEYSTEEDVEEEEEEELILEERKPSLVPKPDTTEVKTEKEPILEEKELADAKDKLEKKDKEPEKIQVPEEQKEIEPDKATVLKPEEIKDTTEEAKVQDKLEIADQDLKQAHEEEDYLLDKLKTLSKEAEAVISPEEVHKEVADALQKDKVEKPLEVVEAVSKHEEVSDVSAKLEEKIIKPTAEPEMKALTPETDKKLEDATALSEKSSICEEDYEMLETEVSIAVKERPVHDEQDEVSEEMVTEKEEEGKVEPSISKEEKPADKEMDELDVKDVAGELKKAVRKEIDETLEKAKVLSESVIRLVEKEKDEAEIVKAALDQQDTTDQIKPAEKGAEEIPTEVKTTAKQYELLPEGDKLPPASEIDTKLEEEKEAMLMPKAEETKPEEVKKPIPEEDKAVKEEKVTSDEKKAVEEEKVTIDEKAEEKKDTEKVLSVDEKPLAEPEKHDAIVTEVKDHVEEKLAKEPAKDTVMEVLDEKVIGGKEAQPPTEKQVIPDIDAMIKDERKLSDVSSALDETYPVKKDDLEIKPEKDLQYDISTEERISKDLEAVPSHLEEISMEERTDLSEEGTSETQETLSTRYDAASTETKSSLPSDKSDTEKDLKEKVVPSDELKAAEVPTTASPIHDERSLTPESMTDEITDVRKDSMKHFEAPVLEKDQHEAPEDIQVDEEEYSSACESDEGLKTLGEEKPVKSEAQIESSEPFISVGKGKEEPAEIKPQTAKEVLPEVMALETPESVCITEEKSLLPDKGKTTEMEKPVTTTEDVSEELLPDVSVQETEKQPTKVAEISPIPSEKDTLLEEKLDVTSKTVAPSELDKELPKDVSPDIQDTTKEKDVDKLLKEADKVKEPQIEDSIEREPERLRDKEDIISEMPSKTTEVEKEEEKERLKPELSDMKEVVRDSSPDLSPRSPAEISSEKATTSLEPEPAVTPELFKEPSPAKEPTVSEPLEISPLSTKEVESVIQPLKEVASELSGQEIAPVKGIDVSVAETVDSVPPKKSPEIVSDKDLEKQLEEIQPEMGLPKDEVVTKMSEKQDEISEIPVSSKDTTEEKKVAKEAELEVPEMPGSEDADVLKEVPQDVQAQVSPEGAQKAEKIIDKSTKEIEPGVTEKPVPETVPVAKDISKELDSHIAEKEAVVEKKPSEVKETEISEAPIVKDSEEAKVVAKDVIPQVEPEEQIALKDSIKESTKEPDSKMPSEMVVSQDLDLVKDTTEVSTVPTTKDVSKEPAEVSPVLVSKDLDIAKDVVKDSQADMVALSKEPEKEIEPAISSDVLVAKDADKAKDLVEDTRQTIVPEVPTEKDTDKDIAKEIEPDVSFEGISKDTAAPKDVTTDQLQEVSEVLTTKDADKDIAKETEPDVSSEGISKDTAAPKDATKDHPQEVSEVLTTKDADKETAKETELDISAEVPVSKDISTPEDITKEQPQVAPEVPPTKDASEEATKEVGPEISSDILVSKGVDVVKDVTKDLQPPVVSEVSKDASKELKETKAEIMPEMLVSKDVGAAEDGTKDVQPEEVVRGMEPEIPSEILGTKDISKDVQPQPVSEVTLTKDVSKELAKEVVLDISSEMLVSKDKEASKDVAKDTQPEVTSEIPTATKGEIDDKSPKKDIPAEIHEKPVSKDEDITEDLLKESQLPESRDSETPIAIDAGKELPKDTKSEMPSAMQLDKDLGEMKDLDKDIQSEVKPVTGIKDERVDKEMPKEILPEVPVAKDTAEKEEVLKDFQPETTDKAPSTAKDTTSVDSLTEDSQLKPKLSVDLGSVKDELADTERQIEHPAKTEVEAKAIQPEIPHETSPKIEREEFKDTQPPHETEKEISAELKPTESIKPTTEPATAKVPTPTETTGTEKEIGAELKSTEDIKPTTEPAIAKIPTPSETPGTEKAVDKEVLTDQDTTKDMAFELEVSVKPATGVITEAEPEKVLVKEAEEAPKELPSSAPAKSLDEISVTKEEIPIKEKTITEPVEKLSAKEEKHVSDESSKICAGEGERTTPSPRPDEFQTTGLKAETASEAYSYSEDEMSDLSGKHSPAFRGSFSTEVETGVSQKVSPVIKDAAETASDEKESSSSKADTKIMEQTYDISKPTTDSLSENLDSLLPDDDAEISAESMGEETKSADLQLAESKLHDEKKVEVPLAEVEKVAEEKLIGTELFSRPELPDYYKQEQPIEKEELQPDISEDKSATKPGDKVERTEEELLESEFSKDVSSGIQEKPAESREIEKGAVPKDVDEKLEHAVSAKLVDAKDTLEKAKVESEAKTEITTKKPNSEPHILPDKAHLLESSPSEKVEEVSKTDIKLPDVTSDIDVKDSKVMETTIPSKDETKTEITTEKPDSEPPILPDKMHLLESSPSEKAEEVSKTDTKLPDVTSDTDVKDSKVMETTTVSKDETKTEITTKKPDSEPPILPDKMHLLESSPSEKVEEVSKTDTKLPDVTSDTDVKDSKVMEITTVSKDETKTEITTKKPDSEPPILPDKTDLLESSPSEKVEEVSKTDTKLPDVTSDTDVKDSKVTETTTISKDESKTSIEPLSKEESIHASKDTEEAKSEDIIASKGVTTESISKIIPLEEKTDDVKKSMDGSELSTTEPRDSARKISGSLDEDLYPADTAKDVEKSDVTPQASKDSTVPTGIVSETPDTSDDIKQPATASEVVPPAKPTLEETKSSEITTTVLDETEVLSTDAPLSEATGKTGKVGEASDTGAVAYALYEALQCADMFEDVTEKSDVLQRLKESTELSPVKIKGTELTEKQKAEDVSKDTSSSKEPVSGKDETQMETADSKLVTDTSLQFEQKSPAEDKTHSEFSQLMDTKEIPSDQSKPTKTPVEEEVIVESQLSSSITEKVPSGKTSKLHDFDMGTSRESDMMRSTETSLSSDGVEDSSVKEIVGDSVRERISHLEDDDLQIQADYKDDVDLSMRIADSEQFEGKLDSKDVSSGKEQTPEKTESKPESHSDEFDKFGEHIDERIGLKKPEDQTPSHKSDEKDQTQASVKAEDAIKPSVGSTEMVFHPDDATPSDLSEKMKQTGVMESSLISMGLESADEGDMIKSTSSEEMFKKDEIGTKELKHEPMTKMTEMDKDGIHEKSHEFGAELQERAETLSTSPEPHAQEDRLKEALLGETLRHAVYDIKGSEYDSDEIADDYHSPKTLVSEPSSIKQSKDDENARRIAEAKSPELTTIQSSTVDIDKKLMSDDVSASKCDQASVLTSKDETGKKSDLSDEPSFSASSVSSVSGEKSVFTADMTMTGSLYIPGEPDRDEQDSEEPLLEETHPSATETVIPSKDSHDITAGSATGMTTSITDIKDATMPKTEGTDKKPSPSAVSDSAHERLPSPAKVTSGPDALVTDSLTQSFYAGSSEPDVKSPASPSSSDSLSNDEGQSPDVSDTQGEYDADEEMVRHPTPPGAEDFYERIGPTSLINNASALGYSAEVIEQPLYEEAEDEEGEYEESHIVEQPVYGSTLKADFPEFVTLSGGTTPSEPQSPKTPSDARSRITEQKISEIETSESSLEKVSKKEQLLLTDKSPLHTTVSSDEGIGSTDVIRTEIVEEIKTETVTQVISKEIEEVDISEVYETTTTKILSGDGEEEEIQEEHSVSDVTKRESKSKDTSSSSTVFEDTSRTVTHEMPSKINGEFVSSTERVLESKEVFQDQYERSELSSSSSKYLTEYVTTDIVDPSSDYGESSQDHYHFRKHSEIFGAPSSNGDHPQKVSEKTMHTSEVSEQSVKDEAYTKEMFERRFKSESSKTSDCMQTSMYGSLSPDEDDDEHVTYSVLSAEDQSFYSGLDPYVTTTSEEKYVTSTRSVKDDTKKKYETEFQSTSFGIDTTGSGEKVPVYFEKESSSSETHDKSFSEDTYEMSRKSARRGSETNFYVLEETTTSSAMEEHSSSSPTGHRESSSGLGSSQASSTPAQERRKEFNIDDWGEPMGLPTPPDPVQVTSHTVKKTMKNTKSTTAMKSLLSKTSDEKNKSSTDSGKSALGSTKSNPMSSGKATSKSAQNGDSGQSSQPVFVDLTYVPHHADSNYCNVSFFKRVRARYYVFSSVSPSKEVLDALLEAKKSWENKDAQVTIIPTYESDTLGYWMADNMDSLVEHKIDIAPSASRCTINLQDHESSCSAYRIEF